MATEISRTWYDGLVNDSGDELSGTVWNKEAVDSLLDAINAMFTAAFSFGATVYLNDTANVQMSLGLTINQGANDDEILAFKSSDIDHGMTAIAEQDTFAAGKKYSATLGGLMFSGLSESLVGLNLRGIMTDDDTAKSTAAVGAIVLQGSKRNAADIDTQGANANLVVIRNHTTTRFIFDAEGDFHYDSSAAAFDEWDDVALARALDLETAGRGVVRSRFDAFVQYRRDDLVRAGILSPSGMVNMTRHTQLLNGAIWQLGARLKALEARVG